MICTGDCNITSRGVIPRPIGGTFLKHAVNVIAYLQHVRRIIPKINIRQE